MLKIPLARFSKRKNVKLVQAPATGLADGGPLIRPVVSNDHLVVATGARHLR